jgi:cobalt-precorrin 5A hydrolase
VKIAVITLSRQGARLAARLAQEVQNADVFVHESAARGKKASSFSSILALTGRIFSQYEGLIYIAPCGVVVRAVAPLLRHKTVDPAVVVVDVRGRYAVSLSSGHEGGANDLAFRVANSIGADPVVSTTTEAAKNLIVGVGCRRGAESKDIAQAIRQGLRQVHARVSQVRVLASADLKKNEAGLIAAAEELGLSLRFIPADEILSTAKKFRHSKFVASKVKLPAVAEPCALLAGRRTQLILPKSIIHGVTVAIARECCM